MSKDIVSGIYCIENIINNKKYIGQSINVFARWNHHKSDLNNNHHDNDYLQKSWNKYGESNFKFYIIEECDSSLLNEREIYYINLYNTLDYNFGYNLKVGGQNGKVTEYGNQKKSESLKKYYQNQETIERQRERALKQWSNPEIKEKITGENNGMYGKHHTEEARKKISESSKGKPSWRKNNTPVFCVELNKIFDSATDAARELNIYPSILEVCKGNRKTCGGYHWKFVMENNI